MRILSVCVCVCACVTCRAHGGMQFHRHPPVLVYSSTRSTQKGRRCGDFCCVPRARQPRRIIISLMMNSGRSIW